MASTILVIEDHASVRILLAKVLQDACEAANGRQGLERFREQPVDLVITDLEMPEMTGLEVILALTRVFLDVKVIAMSGRSADDLQKAGSWGLGRPLRNLWILPPYSMRFDTSCSTSRDLNAGGGGRKPALPVSASQMTYRQEGDMYEQSYRWH